MKYCILLFYISYTQKKKKIIYGPPKNKFLASPLVTVHYNTCYCTTLLYNKDVALKGFLCGRRPTRLNHITLIFLFYTSLSTSTLAYTK